MLQISSRLLNVEASRGLVLEAGIAMATLGAGALLLCVSGAVGLSEGGTIFAAAIYTAICFLVLRGLRQHRPHRHFGLANSITLLRIGFSSILLAFSADTFSGFTPIDDPQIRWMLTALATLSLLLDGLDGWIARRSNMASAFGAQFDMHADALFIFCLTLLLAVVGLAGVWVLASGLLFYVFLLAGLIWPRLTDPLPQRWRRKAVCVVQTALLIFAFAPAVPYLAAQLACLFGLVLLVWSFGIDLVWLSQNHSMKWRNYNTRSYQK